MLPGQGRATLYLLILIWPVKTGVYVCGDIWAPFSLSLKPKYPGMLSVMRKRWPRGVEVWGESLWLEIDVPPGLRPGGERSTCGCCRLGEFTQRQELGRLTDLGDLAFWCVF